MSDFDKILVFDKKTMADLFKEAYTASKKKDKDINDLVIQLKDLINNVGDAVQLVPLIAKYLDVSVANNEHIIKILQIVQKASARIKESEDDNEGMTPEEKAAMLAEYDAFVKSQVLN